MMHTLKLLLNSYHSGANAWFALAEERGYFTDEGLAMEVAIGNGAYRAPILMEEGGHDVTFGDMGSLIRIAAERPGEAPVAIFAVHHTSPSAVAVPAAGPIKTPADLEGRHILTHLSDVAYRTFPAYAAKAGIDVATVSTEISDDTMAQMLTAMLAGKADGVFGYISSQQAVLRQSDPALAAQLAFLPFPEVVPELYGSMILASRAAIGSKPEVLKAFLRALTHALSDAIGDPAAAVEAVLARKPDLDPAIELDRWRYTVEQEMTHAETVSIGFGAVDEGRLAAGARLLAENVPLTGVPTAGELFNPGFLPPLADRLALARACTVDDPV